MLSIEQRQSVEALIRDVGDSYIYSCYRNSKKSDVFYKTSKYDLVTSVDQKAEELLKTGLQELLPESLLLGEETYAQNPDVLDYLKQSAKPVWIIDPIDGTDNFIEKKQGFGIMICLFFDNSLVASWLYEITLKRLTSYYAPDEVYDNGINLEACKKPQAPYKGLIGKKLYRFSSVQGLNEEEHGIIIKPALEPSIIAYREVLLGNLDFLIFRVTYPWDHLPGIALLSTHNAEFRQWNGGKYQYTDVNEGLIVARNAEVMKDVLERVIKPLLGDKNIRQMKSF